MTYSKALSLLESLIINANSHGHKCVIATETQLRTIEHELKCKPNITALQTEAAIGRTVRDILVDRGCTAAPTDEYVHVPTLITEFLDKKDAEIEQLKDHIQDYRRAVEKATIQLTNLLP